jgi:hypothetical protein
MRDDEMAGVGVEALIIEASGTAGEWHIGDHLQGLR